jgi:hypothetical protein
MLNSIFISLVVMATVQQPVPTIVQRSSGWCSPNIANVTGKVTVNCIGVDPRALRRLNAELERKSLETADKIREANEWTEKYKELESRLAAAGEDSVLSRRAEDYLHQGELEKAGAILDQILTAEETQIDRTAANHYNRALVFLLQFRRPDALPHLAKAYDYRPGEWRYGLLYAAVLAQQNDLTRAEPVLLATLDLERQVGKSDAATYYRGYVGSLLLLGSLYSSTQRLTDAEATYLKVVQIYTESKDTSVAELSPDFAIITLTSLAEILRHTQRLTKAEATYLDALRLCRDLARSDPGTYQPAVASTLDALGTLYSDTQRFKEAENVFKEALTIQRDLSRTAQARYQGEIAKTLNLIGLLYSKTQLPKQAEASYREALEIYRQSAKQDPAAYQPAVAATLTNLGLLYTDIQRYPESEAALQEAFETYSNLAKLNPLAYGPQVARAQNNLGNLFARSRRSADADEAYREALDRYRTLVKANPATYQPELAATLNNYANYYKDTHHQKEAEAAFREALKIYRTLANTNSESYLPGVATTLNPHFRFESEELSL